MPGSFRRWRSEIAYIDPQTGEEKSISIFAALDEDLPLADVEDFFIDEGVEVVDKYKLQAMGIVDVASLVHIKSLVIES